MTDAGAASPAEDIAYVRRLAESGARAPLTGGRFMAWWGLLITIAWTAQHFAVNRPHEDGGSIFGIIWFSFGIAGGLGQFVLARLMPAKAGQGSAGNRASRTIWATGAFAIGSMAVGVAVLANSGAGYLVFDWIVPVAFAVYACALIVTGTLAGERIATLAGYGAIAMIGLFTALILHPDRYLIAAVGAAVTVMVPGLLLMLREPRAAE
ncbi:MAG TPA: hypothetical protein VK614_02940 [Allosphingosinicella sp.]|nr:hypothetical protein [Allosphingosinicella sp.]